MGLVPSPPKGMLKSLLFISYIFILFFCGDWGGEGGRNEQNPVQPFALPFTIIKVVKP